MRQAKLIAVGVEEIINNSHIIVLAEPRHLSKDSTSFEVIQSYKGNAPATVTAHHTGVEHDQRIESIGRHILFLIQTSDETWAPAAHGVSYWPLVDSRNSGNNLDSTCEWSVPNTDPLSMVSMGEILPTEKVVRLKYLPYEYDGVKMWVYCQNDVVKFIKSQGER